MSMDEVQSGRSIAIESDSESLLLNRLVDSLLTGLSCDRSLLGSCLARVLGYGIGG